MPTRRIKKSFTAGALDPLLGARVDFARYKDGCRVLKNMVCLPTGAVTRRPGSKFIHDMVNGGTVPIVPDTPVFKMPFVVDAQKSLMIMLYHTTSADVDAIIVDDDVATHEAVSSLLPSSAGSDFTLEDMDYAQYGKRLYITQENVKPFYMEYDPVTTNWTIQEITFTAQPTDWGAGAWPLTVTFHQQRSYWGGNSVRPQAIWASAVGEEQNMGAHSTITPPTVADGFSFNLESNIWDKIAWMYPDKVLNVGTLGQEWIVTGLGGSGPITGVVTGSYTGVQATIQTGIGSLDVNPIKIGGALNFIGGYGRNIFEFQYDFARDNYLTSDKSILAQHLTDNNPITRWCYQRIPYGIMWATADTGNLLGCTLVPEHKVAGWHEHDTEGTIKHVCSIPSYTSGQDLVFMLVEREANIFIERLDINWVEPDPDTDVDYYLDSYMEFVTPGATLTGLTHLANREVELWVDGMSLSTATVSAGGELTLDEDNYDNVVVGLPYISEVRPYLNDIITQEGSVFGQMQRITSLDIDFYNTIGGVVGASYQEEDGTETEITEDLQFRTQSSPMGSRIPRYTGIYHFTFNEGNDRKSEYFIRQTYPQPMTVRGVVDIVEVG